MIMPMANMMIPAISHPVPNLGWLNLVTFGEFRIVTGNEMIQTHDIWMTQNPRKEKNLPRILSKRSSFLVLRIRKKRKPDSRAPQSMMKREATICRA